MVAATVESHGRSRFYFRMAVLLSFIVVAGFAPSFFLRPFFDVPPKAPIAYVHAVIMTTWFVIFVLQTYFVGMRRVDLHRRLGVAGAVVGAVIVLITFSTDLGMVDRTVESGGNLPGVTRIFWSDFGSTLAYALFMVFGIALRYRPEFHKRLMLLASISLVGPALSRISSWPVFDGIGPDSFSTIGLFLLIAALWVHDLSSRKGLQTVTVLGGLFLFLVGRVFFRFILGGSEIGRSIVMG